MENLILFGILLFVSVTAAYRGTDLPPSYCSLPSEIGGQCGKGRQDSNSRIILGKTCYCDEFCKDSYRLKDDCCPDYEEVCLGEEPWKEIKSNNVSCMYNGRRYQPNELRERNCNTCMCTLDASNTTRWFCSEEQCLVSDDVTFEINRRNESWRAFSYPKFLNRRLMDGVIYKLGTLPLDEFVRRMNPIFPPNETIVKIENVTNFDARKEWPLYITPVRDQGWCGSDWAMSLAAVATDRFAILSKGAEKPELSPQLFLSCMPRLTDACRGGRVDVAWNFARIFGMVNEECFPYQAQKTICQFRNNGNLRDDGCQPSVKERTDRYRVSPIARFMGEKNIMAEISSYGPVQAVMKVYQDFFHYRDGVYKHQQAGDQRIYGFHSVRVIGWGEDRGEKYWIVANSWGPEWGENGYFRILRGANEVGIEDFIVTIIPRSARCTRDPSSSRHY